MRTALRAGILLLWVGIMAALYARVTPDAVTAPALSSDLPAEGAEAWQGIYGEGKKIGYAFRRRSVTDTGFLIENRAVLRVVMMGAPRVVQTDVAVRTDRRLQLEGFSFQVRSGTLEFEAEGSARPGVLEVRFPHQEDRSIRIPVSSPIVLPQTLHEILRQESIETGKVYRYSMFDPLSAEPSAVELRVGAFTSIDVAGKSHDAYEVTQEFRGSTFRLWIDREGEVLREEGPLGLLLLREDEQSAAIAGFGEGGTLDIVAASAIPVDRDIPFPRELQRLRVRLSGLPPGRDVAFPPRQTIEGQFLRIQREEEASIASFDLPARDPAVAAELVATPLVQSDSPRVRALAAEILADERDARTAARRLLDWVFRTLEKVPTASVPSALDVLETREGDCNEHSVLYTALARSAGLPARIAAGAVYMPGEGGDRGAFFYHAWVEVWLGRWISLDPTLGQFPADATHVKFLDGGPETHANLVGLIGRLSVDVEDFG